jgi:hypothetical protein
MHAEPSGSFQNTPSSQGAIGGGFIQNQMGFNAGPMTPSFSRGAPSGSFQNKASNAYNSRSLSPSETDLLWEELKQQPGNFWDNRNKKLSSKSPDFKHKVSGAALWLNSCPPSFDPSKHLPSRAHPSRPRSIYSLSNLSRAFMHACMHACMHCHKNTFAG